MDGWMNGRMSDKLLFHFGLHSHKVIPGRPNNYLSRKSLRLLTNITRRHRGTDIGATRSNSGFPSSNKIFNIMNYHFHIYVQVKQNADLKEEHSMVEQKKSLKFEISIRIHPIVWL